MSRLRNRIRKADYFTDGELLRWPRDKRTTYSALWAMAEDSGCLEDDCFEWKMTIWPSPLDADITVEVLEQWRDELTIAGKLIPYEAEGKRYLFLRNFHQHEKPTNPQRPDLPLPPWVVAEVTEGRSKDQKKWSRCQYTVCTELIPSRELVRTEFEQGRTAVSTDEIVCTDGGEGSVQTQIQGGLRSPVQSSPVQTRPDQTRDKEPPLPPKPVDNSGPPAETEELGRSIDQEDQEPVASDGAKVCAGDTCDGEECSVRCFPASAFAPLHRVILKSLHHEQWGEVGKGGTFDALLAEYAGHLCDACQAALGEFSRPQLDDLCERAMTAAIESLDGSQDVAKVMRTRLTRYGLAELIGDRKLEELRRTRRDKRRKGEPKPIGACLPDVGAVT